MHRSTVYLIPAILLAATASAVPVVEDNAILNGEFELAAHPARLATCPAFGDESIHVVDPASGTGLPWVASVSPCHSSAVTAAQWSHGSGALFEDFDGDGDREAKILPGIVDPTVGGHNLWQAYSNPQQAYTADFDAFTFRVESGTVPPGAVVILSLSQSPLSDATPWIGLWFECQLTFKVAHFAKAGNVWSVDPANGIFASRDPSCADDLAAWNAATSADERRDVLAAMRIVQTSFWSFHTGSAPVVLDGVAILGASTAAEAAVGL